MALYFLDTSGLVKRYVLETGTAWVQTLASPTAAHSLFIARITYVETISAVTRRVRGGFLAAPDGAANAHLRFLPFPGSSPRGPWAGTVNVFGRVVPAPSPEHHSITSPSRE